MRPSLRTAVDKREGYKVGKNRKTGRESGGRKSGRKVVLMESMQFDNMLL